MKMLFVGVYDTNTVSLAPQLLRACVAADPGLRDVQSSTIEFSLFTATAQSMASAIEAKKPDVVCFSAYIWNMSLILETVPLLSARVVLGGPQVTGVEREILARNPGVDMVVTGEGESVCPAIARCLMDGTDPASIPGVTTRTGSTPMYAEPVDLDSLPRFYGELFASHPDLEWISFETSRGCPSACRYCTWACSKRMRFHSLERVLEELTLILAQPGIRNIYFCDSSLLFNKKRAKAILRHILDSGSGKSIRFEFNAEHLDDETIDIMARLPDMEFNFGLQTVNPAALKAMNRGFNRDKFERNYRKVADRVGEGKVTLDLIYGLPGDDFQGYRDSVRYALSLGRPKRILTNPLILLPGSYFHAHAMDFGIAVEDAASCLVDHTASFTASDMQAARVLSLRLAAVYLNDALQDAMRAFAEHSGRELLDVVMEFFDQVGFPSGREVPDMIPSVAKGFKRRNEVMAGLIGQFDGVVDHFREFSGHAVDHLLSEYPYRFTEQYHKLKRFAGQ